MTDTDSLEAFLLTTIRALDGCELGELCASLHQAFPDLAPATMHDHLNNLLASGGLILTTDGIYKTP